MDSVQVIAEHAVKLDGRLELVTERLPTGVAGLQDCLPAYLTLQAFAAASLADADPATGLAHVRAGELRVVAEVTTTYGSRVFGHDTSLFPMLVLGCINADLGK